MDYRALARQFAIEAGIDPDIFEAQINQESGFNPNAYNPSGATGIAQIVPQWHPNVDANDPVASLQYAAQLMANHLQNYNGDYRLALAAYNAGPGNVQKYGGVPPFSETQNYIASILGAASGGGKPGLLSPQPDPGGPGVDTYVDEQGNTVTYDVASGDIISVTPPAATPPAGTTSPAGPVGSNGAFVTPPTSNYTPISQDPTNAGASRYATKDPPWITAGYRTFDAWSAAIGEQKAADILYRQQQSDLLQKQIDSNNAGTGASTVNAKIAAQTAANALAEQKRQFDLDYANAQTPAERAALLKEQQRQFDLSQEVDKGKTLLGLGSRPDTLIKYLYAIRGQQTPQGIENTTQNLPGFGSNPGAGAPGPAAPAPGAPGPGNVPGGPTVDPRVAAVKNAIATPGPIDPKFVAPGGTNITATDPRLGPASGQVPTQTLQAGQAPTATQGPTQEQLGAQDALTAAGRTPRFFSNGVAIFKHGGPIPEPVLGVGLHSGQTYEFGEAGPEYVIPHDKLSALLGMTDGGGQTDASGTRKYASGGTIGYTPTADQQQYIQSQIAATAKANAAQPVPSAAAPAPSPASAMTPVATPQPTPTRPLAPAPQLTSPTVADTAMIGGVKTWAGGAYSGMPVGSTPANAGDLSPYLRTPGLADPTGRVPTPPAAPSQGVGITDPGFGTPSWGASGNYYGPNNPMVGFPGGNGPSFNDMNPSMGVFPGETTRSGPRPPLGQPDSNFVAPWGSQSAGFFNDPRLRDVVARGYNSNPNVPLFPQIGVATNYGSSLIPSQQRYNSLLPSEQSLYAGALQDEFGAQPNDVFALARKLAPQSSGLRTPRFTG